MAEASQALLVTIDEGDGEDVPVTVRRRTLMGTDVHDDAEDDCKYVMVFNRTADATQPVRNPADVLQDCINPRMLEAWSQDEPEFFQKVMEEGNITWGDFMDAIWNRTIKVLRGRACGFNLGFKPSLDGKSTLLFISISSQSPTIDQLADRVGMQLRATPMSYTIKGMTCPKVAPTLEARLGLINADDRDAPVYLKYDSTRKRQFQAATAERVRNAEKRIDEILEEWSKADDKTASQKVKAKVRRLMRLEDVRAAVLVVMVDRMGGTDESRLTTYKEIFTEMNVFLEKQNVDLQIEVEAAASEKEKWKIRLDRWSAPRYPDLKKYLEATLYDDISDLDVLRLVKRRIGHFLNISSMEKHGIISGFFPPHRTKDIKKLSESWASLHWRNILQWPGSQHDEMVRDYFGEEVAFFFDWLGYMTRMLLFPAILSLVSGISLDYLDEDPRRRLRSAFSVLMCVWAAHLTASYDQVTNTRNIVWGMKGYEAHAMIRSQYEPRLRGSCREAAIRAAHWALVFLFVGQTICAAGYIANFRHEALRAPSGETRLPWGFTISNEMAATVGLYAVTANIKIMDFIWDYISPLISAEENWRTDQALKNHEVTKSFFVKCVVYYYPFFYLAFLRDFVEGCEGNECLHDLKVNLAVFIGTHIATVVLSVLYQMAHSRYMESALQKQVAKELNASQLSYVQVQASRPPYAGDTADYMELSIVLGFISMFSVVYPFLAFMAFVSNLIEMRILAFRMCRVTRRPVPRGQEGVGAWLTVMKFLTYLSCVTCVALCIFVLKPLKEFDMETKLGGFVITEHTMLAVAYLVGQAIPSKSVSAELITENNDEAAERILGGDAQEVHAEEGDYQCLLQGTEQMLPGIAFVP